MEISQTQRIVILVDLHPLLLHLENPNPNPYTIPILAAARALLSSLPPTTLAAWKPFFSSLCPIVSTSLAHRLLGCAPSFLFFDRPEKILTLISETLQFLPSITRFDSPPRASTLAKSLLQLEHDYAWEPGTPNSEGTRESLPYHSNLIVLFSPFPRNLGSLSGFLDVELGNGENVLTWDVFKARFSLVFGLVKDRFVSKDIHVCWVDVNFGLECEKEENLGLGFLRRGIKELGWGCYSTDLIVLGSSIIPFGLIFPYIGCSSGYGRRGKSKVGSAELVLQITDVSGNPLECKMCELEVFDLGPLRKRSDFCDQVLGNWGRNPKRIHFQKLFREIEEDMVIKNFNHVSLICGVSGGSKEADGGNPVHEFFADKVLQLLIEDDGFTLSKPTWQILLAFLYNRGYWSLVTISGCGGNCVRAILRPFTINNALLYLSESNSLDLQQFLKSTYNLSSEKLSNANAFSLKVKAGGKKVKKLNKKLLQDISWNSFCKRVLTQSDDDAMQFQLEEIYFALESNMSKKLRFLKCWMRQTKESRDLGTEEFNEVIESPDVKEAVDERENSHKVSEPIVVSSSAGWEVHQSISAGTETSTYSSFEDAEAFLESITQKIEQCLHSEESDLRLLANCLVDLSVQAVHKHLQLNRKMDSVDMEANDASNVKIATEVSRLLLQKPKDLLLKHKGGKSAAAASDLSSAKNSTRNKIREHELQMLFRMEILQSKLGASIEENMVQKMVKEICSLLQNIEFDLEGDLFHGESLVDFAGRTIKSRYAHSLGYIISKIYNQMEFFSFDADDMETSESLPNSYDDESHRDENAALLGGGDLPKEMRASSCQGTTSPGLSSYPLKNDKKKMEETLDGVHHQRLMRAQERRERERHWNFRSFTTWMPDLQRVWAPKHPRVEKTHDTMTKLSKRRKKSAKTNDVVCETPLTGKQDESKMEDGASSGTSSCRLLSKALFQ